MIIFVLVIDGARGCVFTVDFMLSKLSCRAKNSCILLNKILFELYQKLKFFGCFTDMALRRASWLSLLRLTKKIVPIPIAGFVRCYVTQEIKGRIPIDIQKTKRDNWTCIKYIMQRNKLILTTLKLVQYRIPLAELVYPSKSITALGKPATGLVSSQAFCPYIRIVTLKSL